MVDLLFCLGGIQGFGDFDVFGIRPLGAFLVGVEVSTFLWAALVDTVGSYRNTDVFVPSGLVGIFCRCVGRGRI